MSAPRTQQGLVVELHGLLLGGAEALVTGLCRRLFEGQRAQLEAKVMEW